MLASTELSPVSSALPLVAVIAITAVVALAITTRFVYLIARQALEKAEPGGVASVLLALGALINPLRYFMPWFGADEVAHRLLGRGSPAEVLRHNDVRSDLIKEGEDVG